MHFKVTSSEAEAFQQFWKSGNTFVELLVKCCFQMNGLLFIFFPKATEYSRNEEMHSLYGWHFWQVCVCHQSWCSYSPLLAVGARGYPFSYPWNHMYVSEETLWDSDTARAFGVATCAWQRGGQVETSPGRRAFQSCKDIGDSVLDKLCRPEEN